MKLDFNELLNNAGLKAGDRIKLVESTDTFTIVKDKKSNGVYLERESDKSYESISNLQFDFELIKPKKKVGELLCLTMACINCPLHCIACKGCLDIPIRRRFKATLEEFPELEPMRAYFEKELDKEVE